MHPLSRFFLLLALAAGSALAAPTYHEPKLDPPLFDVSKVALAPQDRTRIATNLGSYVQRLGANPAQAQLDFAAQTLGFALWLDPENRSASILNSRLRRGLSVAAEGPFVDVKLISTDLHAQARAVKKVGGEDNDKVAGYLLELAVAINPENDDAAYDLSLFRRAGRAADWSFVETEKPAATPAPTPKPSAAPSPPGASDPLTKTQSSLRGLLVYTLENGKHTAIASEIIATALPAAESGEPTTFTINQEVGKDMEVAFQEAVRLVKTRHPSMARGNAVTLSFAQKYSGKDGPSAGTAFALLMLSLFEKFEFAGDVAVTGDITVDGRVRPVGGVPSKIRGAMRDGCKAVAIPIENKNAVGDLAILYPPETLWRVQIFTADKVGDALDVMRADRPEKIGKAMELFSSVQGALAGSRPDAYLVSAPIQRALAQVLELAPNHLSAEFMLTQARRQAPKALSLNTSLDEMFSAVSPVYQGGRAAQQAYEDVYARLSWLQFRIDNKAAGVQRALVGMIKAKEQWDRSGGSRSLQIKYLKDYEVLKASLEKINSDTAAVEDMIRE